MLESNSTTSSSKVFFLQQLLLKLNMKKKAKRENTFVGSVDINKISLRSCQARKRGIITNYREVGMKA